MKKLLSVIAFLFVLVGCGSKNILTDPQEIYEKMKESGMSIELTDMDDGVFGTISGDDSYKISFINASHEEGQTLILLIYDKQNEDNTYTVMSDPKNENSARITVGECTIDASTEKEMNDSNECNEADISDAKVMKKNVLSHFSESDITPEGISDMCKWYIKEKGVS